LKLLYTLSQKNAPTSASCSFEKHRLILIILGKQHQRTFNSDMFIQLSFFLHFYVLYLLLKDATEVARYQQHEAALI